MGVKTGAITEAKQVVGFQKLLNLSVGEERLVRLAVVIIDFTYPKPRVPPPNFCASFPLVRRSSG